MYVEACVLTGFSHVDFPQHGNTHSQHRRVLFFGFHHRIRDSLQIKHVSETRENLGLTCDLSGALVLVLVFGGGAGSDGGGAVSFMKNN